MTTKEKAQAALDELASLAYRDSSKPDFVIDSWKETIIAALEAMAGDKVVVPLKTAIQVLEQARKNLPLDESDMTEARIALALTILRSIDTSSPSEFPNSSTTERTRR